MKKKAIALPVDLVQELRKKIADSYSGDIIDGFIFYLNKNLEILKRESVIYDNVFEIKELKNGVIEHGDFTKDIIKNAIMREPYQGKKKLIKALIIAAFGNNWESVYTKHYNIDGDLIESKVVERKESKMEAVSSLVKPKFILLHDFYDSFNRIEFSNRIDRKTLEKEIINPFRLRISKLVPNCISYELDNIRSEIKKKINNRYFIITMDDGSYFLDFDYNFNITRTAYSIEHVKTGPYFRIPRDDDRDIISQGQNCHDKYIRIGNQKPIILCDDGVGTGKSLEKILNILGQLKINVAKIFVLLNPNNINCISNNDIETILKIDEDFAWLSERDLFWGLPRSGVTCSISSEKHNIITGIPYTIDNDMIEKRIANFGNITTEFRLTCIKYNIRLWEFFEEELGQKILIKNVKRLQGFGHVLGIDDERLVDYLQKINFNEFKL